MQLPRHRLLGSCLVPALVSAAAAGCAGTPPAVDLRPIETPRVLATAGGGATASADADPAAPPQGVCDWVLRDGELVPPQPGGSPPVERDDHLVADDEVPPDPAVVDATEVDLDGVPPRDWIANVGGCGNWQDCQFVVLQGCGRDTYRVVWGPEYAQDVDIHARRRRARRGLPDLVVHGRTAMAGCDLPLMTIVSWNGTEWVSGPTCAGESDIWDDDDCGPRPTACDATTP